MRVLGVGLGETFSNLFSKFAGVGRNLQAPGKIVASLGSGMRKVVWILQHQKMADYIRAALMLRFNDRAVG
jgi:hypothetical protein